MNYFACSQCKNILGGYYQELNIYFFKPLKKTKVDGKNIFCGICGTNNPFFADFQLPIKEEETEIKKKK